MTLESSRGRPDDEPAGGGPVCHCSVSSAGGTKPFDTADTAVAHGFEPWAGAIRPRLVGLARRFLWNLSDAEEVAQEALLLAWRHERHLADAGVRNAWAYRTTINLCLSRRRKRRPEPLPELEPLARAERAESLESAELMQCVRAAMMQLPGRQQTALVLRDLEGLGYEQVAGVMNTTAGSARLLAHRGREAVREILLRRWPDSFKGLS